MAQVFTPYSSARPFFPGLGVPTGLSDWDTERVQSYATYEQFYWNHPESYKIVIRGEDERALYLPSAKEIIEATNRFLAVNWNYSVEGADPDSAIGTAMQDLFKREAMYTKFASQRRYGLIRGDAVWHITADDSKPLGTRISIHDVDPSTYFPIYDADDPTRRIAVYLVDVVKDPRDPDNKRFVNRRQAYRRTLDANGRPTGEITTELALFEIGKWNDQVLKRDQVRLVEQLVPPTPLPPDITSIPVYHITNTSPPPGSAWNFGSSQLRGIETVFAALQQGATDQALAVALGGLGVYVTDAGPPRDSEGAVTAWQFGPGQITEVPAGSVLNRVGELSSIDPSLDHLKWLGESAQTGAGIPDIAAGRVDVAIAESGIALALKMSPILASNAEKESAMLGIYDQMLYDLTKMWFPAYEELRAPEVDVVAVVGDPMPVNRSTKIAEIQLLAAQNLITTEMAIDELGKLGYDFPANAAAKLLEQTAAKTASSDPFSARSDQELNNNGESAGAGNSSSAD